MNKSLRQSIRLFLKKIGDFFVKTNVGRFIGLSGVVIGFLQTIGIWENLLMTVTKSISLLGQYLLFPIFSFPIYFWVLVIWLTLWLRSQSKYLKLVSGEFVDDFRHGLSNWEYGGDSWKTEYEDEEPYLSVTESSDGGISKKGFSWSDYEFSFKAKMINKNAGWIVRAENRNKYLMIQLNMEKEPYRLRLHLRVPPLQIPGLEGTHDWLVMQENEVNLDKQIKFFEWIDIRIVVFGSNIDVYINSQHAAHYFIPDPIRWGNVVRKKDETGIKEDTYVASVNYSAGKVGFRCSGHEHSHFRDVRVKPLL